VIQRDILRWECIVWSWSIHFVDSADYWSLWWQQFSLINPTDHRHLCSCRFIYKKSSLLRWDSRNFHKSCLYQIICIACFIVVERLLIKSCPVPVFVPRSISFSTLNYDASMYPMVRGRDSWVVINFTLRLMALPASLVYLCLGDDTSFEIQVEQLGWCNHIDSVWIKYVTMMIEIQVMTKLNYVQLVYSNGIMNSIE